jgi:hypothetical protein
MMDSAVLLGAASLLERWRPELLVESLAPEASALLSSLGYVERQHAPGVGIAHYVHAETRPTLL